MTRWVSLIVFLLLCAVGAFTTGFLAGGVAYEVTHR